MNYEDIKTPKGATTFVARKLKAIAKKTGYDPDGIVVRSPEESKDLIWGECWNICWEEGPYEWSILCSAGEDIFQEELQRMGKATIPGIFNNRKVLAEPYNSYSLCFYKN